MTNCPTNDNQNIIISSVEKVTKNIKTVNNYESEINRLLKEIKG